ncbi:M20/M25/M40 family metallo-hydrolase [Caulobacter sp. KR2-114]|uniref:M20/M25/M40 family metallo-hydrolase n=1 Tax=Caulobacter sp. KR2-114 TaxID=3400912 RepID=UPI003C020A84
MRLAALAVLIALVAGGADAQPAGPAEQPVLRQVAGEVQADELHATIARLVGFGTRHTLSDTTSPTRGIGAARLWVKGRFGEISQACGGCLEVVTPSQVVSGERVPKPTEVMDVIGIQRGSGDPNRVVVISGHLDSRVSDPMNATSDAPGANDDASGVAAVLEAARVLSRHRFQATIVYAVLSGEEQNLYGGKLLADYATAQGWRVEADLNNDIVGNTRGQDGHTDDTHVRVFSEGTKAVETQAQADRRRYNGGEVDSPSRQVARHLDGLADQYLTGLDVVMVYRTDRFSRGGDQVRMLEAGFPAVRVTEADENYTRQHQDVRTENGVAYGDVIAGVDFPYLAQVTRLNVLGLAAMASAPAPPEGVKIEGAVSPDTRVSWTATPGATGYRVWWRDTTAAQWRFSRDAGPATSLVLPGVNIDDWFFGVQALGPDGAASPVVFPGPAGDFVSERPAK